MEWLAPRPNDRAAAPHPAPRVLRLLVHVSPAAPTGKHVGSAHATGDRLRLPTSDNEARKQKGEEGDATLDLVLKHLDAAIATYV